MGRLKEDERMKETGVIRKIDELGSVSIPADIRKSLRWRENMPLEFCIGSSGALILKPYATLNGFEKYAEKYLESLQHMNRTFIITDMTKVIAATSDAYIGELVGETFLRAILDKFPVEDVPLLDAEQTRMYMVPILEGGVAARYGRPGEPIGALGATTGWRNEAATRTIKTLLQTGADFLGRLAGY
jgi:AbrB family looped-hinge helix DNA binding protein